MSAIITDGRLAELRGRAELAARMTASDDLRGIAGRHTVELAPAELAALVEEVFVLRGQQLIDLQRAYESGAMSRREYEREREKLLED